MFFWHLRTLLFSLEAQHLPRSCDCGWATWTTAKVWCCATKRRQSVDVSWRELAELSERCSLHWKNVNTEHNKLTIIIYKFCIHCGPRCSGSDSILIILRQLRQCRRHWRPMAALRSWWSFAMRCSDERCRCLQVISGSMVSPKNGATCINLRIIAEIRR